MACSCCSEVNESPRYPSKVMRTKVAIDDVPEAWIPAKFWCLFGPEIVDNSSRERSQYFSLRTTKGSRRPKTNLWWKW